MSKQYAKDNATYHRLLDAAEALFMERGLAAVTLQDIASAIEMRHASLYYYAPKGKEQLYVAVMERTFKQHGEGLTDAVIQAGDDFRAQMHAVATWFATHAHTYAGISFTAGNAAAQRVYEGVGFQLYLMYGAEYFEGAFPGTINYRMRLA
jgi:AcrR family transcriptional regulator